MPSNTTTYLVFRANEDGSLRPVAQHEARDHKHACDAVLDLLPVEQRNGRLGACPARNFRMFNFGTEVEYKTTSEEVELAVEFVAEAAA